MEAALLLLGPSHGRDCRNFQFHRFIVWNLRFQGAQCVGNDMTPISLFLLASPTIHTIHRRHPPARLGLASCMQCGNGDATNRYRYLNVNSDALPDGISGDILILFAPWTRGVRVCDTLQRPIDRPALPLVPLKIAPLWHWRPAVVQLGSSAHAPPKLPRFPERLQSAITDQPASFPCSAGWGRLENFFATAQPTQAGR